MTMPYATSAPTVRLIASIDGGEPKPIPILGERFLIGRDRDCQLRLRNPLVSRHHAEIWIAGEDVYLRDLNSSNGTYLNGPRVTQEMLLEDGDTVLVGPVEVTVSIQSASVRPHSNSSQHSWDDEQLPSDEEVAKWLFPDVDNDASPPDATHKST
jgi:pSer/pThr/pTyr-binding forkhead associated (FHA) protein